MLKYLTAVAISLVFLLASVTGLAQATGADTYKAKCQMCHGADGLGNTPAGKAMNAHPFNSPDVLKESDADLTTIIKGGKMRKSRTSWGISIRCRRSDRTHKVNSRGYMGRLRLKPAQTKERINATYTREA
jgi:hypothetical protein